MMPIILSKDIFATLRQLHPLPSTLDFPLIFYYQFEHTFVLNMTLFTWALVTTPHSFSGGLSRMVYKHLLGCFISKGPSLGFLELFQAVIIVTHGDIHRSMALVLGANKLLATAKDIRSYRLIIVGKTFFQLINRSIVLEL
jgi:hypothetical protein